MAKIEELHERIEFLEDVVEKQKIEMDKAYLDHLKEIQNIVIMRKSERGWSKYE